MLCHRVGAQTWVFSVGFADDSGFVIKTHLAKGAEVSVKHIFLLLFLRSGNIAQNSTAIQPVTPVLK